MRYPKVTVLMSVYNGERYLPEAMESVLAQTFTDFEFLIIDDASTDGTAHIISACEDPRIRLVRNVENLGLTASLNRGIDLSLGQYIARIDCDDICHAERLSRQVAFLDTHPDCAALATTVVMINVLGEDVDVWEDDRQTLSYEAIRRFLPKANCLAHPSMMMRREVIARYRYDERHRVAQDYDLWLRLCADGVRIEKLAEPLLRYRMNPESITTAGNRKRPELKKIRTKLLFLAGQTFLSSSALFNIQVFFSIFRDLAFLVLKELLKGTEQVFGNLGRLMGRLLPIRNPSGLFFFFPFCHVGGAEKVHVDIVSCFVFEKPWVFFTKWSPRKGVLREEFAKSARTFNLSLLLKYTYPLSAGFMAGIINRHPAAVVFGCNTLFFYKMLPFLTPQVKVVDLLHAFGGGAEYFALPVLHRIDKRVVITAVTREDIAHQYQCYGIDKALVERVVLIENRVEVPLVCSVKRMADRLNILYVGRGSEEKRLHLIGQIAALCKRNELPVTIRLVGDVAEGLPESDRAFCEIIGEVTDRERLASLYDEAHMLILTSSREGFPVVVMEAMARGVVPLTTDVGGISDHVSNGISGWLVPNDTDEEVIVKTMYGIIERACSDRSVLTDMACAAYSHAKEHFRNDRFCAAYRILLLGPQA